MDTITILVSPDGELLTKTGSYENAELVVSTKRPPKLFTIEFAALRKLGTLSRVLGLLEPEPRKAIIRGTLKDGVFPDLVTRSFANAGAPFKSLPHHWICIDIDELGLPD